MITYKHTMSLPLNYSIPLYHLFSDFLLISFCFFASSVLMSVLMYTGIMVINALLDYSSVQIAIKPNRFHPHTGINWQVKELEICTIDNVMNYWDTYGTCQGKTIKTWYNCDILRACKANYLPNSTLIMYRDAKSMTMFLNTQW